VVIAATGYTTGLEPLVGHLDVLDERGVPLIHGGPAAAAGLRFIGYQRAGLFVDEEGFGEVSSLGSVQSPKL
jgi:hypothetical protein